MKCITKFCRKHRAKKGGSLCSKCMMRRWRAANPVKYRLGELRNRARKKKIPFDLDLGWLTDFLSGKAYDPAVHHIDRICSLGGYTKGNLQLLDGVDNIAKGNRERHGQAHLY